MADLLKRLDVSSLIFKSILVGQQTALASDFLEFIHKYESDWDKDVKPHDDFKKFITDWLAATKKEAEKMGGKYDVTRVLKKKIQHYKDMVIKSMGRLQDPNAADNKDFKQKMIKHSGNHFDYDKWLNDEIAENLDFIKNRKLDLVKLGVNSDDLASDSWIADTKKKATDLVGKPPAGATSLLQLGQQDTNLSFIQLADGSDTTTGTSLTRVTSGSHGGSHSQPGPESYLGYAAGLCVILFLLGWGMRRRAGLHGGKNINEQAEERALLDLEGDIGKYGANEVSDMV